MRAVGKLVGMEGDRVQLQLAGEGAPAPRGKLARRVAPRRPRRANPLFPRRPASAPPSRVVSVRGDRTGPLASIDVGNDSHRGSYVAEMMNKGFYEVIGTLQADGTIASMTTTTMGDGLDMDMYAEMVTLTHQFPDLY